MATDLSDFQSRKTNEIYEFFGKAGQDVTKPELGTKRDCPECGARFYDLHKEPAHCPKCHHEFVPEALLKPRKTRAEEESDKSEEGEIESPEQETSLEEADNENKEAESNRKGNLDDEDGDDNGEDIPDIEGLGVDLADDDDQAANDSTLLDEDDDDDVSDIIKPPSDDD